MNTHLTFNGAMVLWGIPKELSEGEYTIKFDKDNAASIKTDKGWQPLYNTNKDRGDTWELGMTEQEGK